MTPRCLNFIPISGMGPRNLPEDTHVIFQPTLVHWNMCLYFKFQLCTQRWHVPSQNHEPSWEKLRFARILYQNLFLFGHFLPQHGSTMTWHPCQVSWFSDVFWIYKNFKTKFLNVLGRATMPRCFNFIRISCRDLEIHPRTQMWFFNQLWCTRACACSSNLTYAH